MSDQVGVNFDKLQAHLLGSTPAQCNLKDVLEIGNRAVTANEEALPDHGADAKEHDFELVDDEF